MVHGIGQTCPWPSRLDLHEFTLKYGLNSPLFHLDNQLRDQRANGLILGDSMTTKFPLTNNETGETIGVSIYDYFTKFSPYKVAIKYPK